MFVYLMELFFIISGYLMIYSDREENRHEQIGHKLFHKLSRLYPVAILSTLICLILKIILDLVGGDLNQIHELLNTKSMITNFLLLFAGYPYMNMRGINNPLWYVCVLIQCIIFGEKRSFKIMDILGISDNNWYGRI